MFAFPHESPQLSTQFSSNLKSKIASGYASLGCAGFFQVR
jgi:hypothetical protein